MCSIQYCDYSNYCAKNQGIVVLVMFVTGLSLLQNDNQDKYIYVYVVYSKVGQCIITPCYGQ